MHPKMYNNINNINNLTSNGFPRPCDRRDFPGGRGGPG